MSDRDLTRDFRSSSVMRVRRSLARHTPQSKGKRGVARETRFVGS